MQTTQAFMTVPAFQASSLASQALNHAKYTAEQIAGIAGLPSQALPIQADAVALLHQIAPVVSDIQQRIQEFAHFATPLLTDALTALAGSEPGQAKAGITRIETAAAALRPMVGKVSTLIGMAREKTDHHVVEMESVERTLGSDIAAAKAEERTAQAEVDSIHKQQYWHGLGAVWWSAKAEEKVAAIQARIHTLDGQVSRFTKMKIDVGQLRQDLQTLSGNLQSLENAIGFVSADIRSAAEDLGNAATTAATKGYLLVAREALAMLATETA